MGMGGNRAYRNIDRDRAQAQELRYKASEPATGSDDKIHLLEEAKGIWEKLGDEQQVNELQGLIQTARKSKFQEDLNAQADQEALWERQDQAEKKEASRLKKLAEEQRRQKAESEQQERLSALDQTHQLLEKYSFLLDELTRLQSSNSHIESFATDYVTTIAGLKAHISEIQIGLQPHLPTETLFTFIETKQKTLEDIKKNSKDLLTLWPKEDPTFTSEVSVNIKLTKIQLSVEEEQSDSISEPDDSDSFSFQEIESEELPSSVIIDYGIPDPELEEELPLSADTKSGGSLLDELNEVEQPIIPSPQEAVVHEEEKFEEPPTSTLIITDQELQLLLKRIESVEEYDEPKVWSLYKYVEELIEKAKKISNIYEYIPIYNAAINLLKAHIERQNQLSSAADDQRQEIDYIVNELNNAKNGANRFAIAVLSEKAANLETNNTLRSAAITQSEQKISEIEALIETTKKRTEQDLLDEQLKLKAQQEKETVEKAQAEKETRKKLQQQKKAHQKEQEFQKQQKQGLMAEANALITRCNSIRKNIENNLREKNPGLKDEYDEFVAFLEEQIAHLETLIDIAINTDDETDSIEGLAQEKQFNATLREALEKKTKEIEEVIAAAHVVLLKARKGLNITDDEKNSVIEINAVQKPETSMDVPVNLNYIKKTSPISQSKLTDKPRVTQPEKDSEPPMQNLQSHISRVEQPPIPQTHTTYNSQLNLQEVQIKNSHTAHLRNQLKVTDKYSATTGKNDSDPKKQEVQEKTSEVARTVKEYQPAVNIKKVQKITPQMPQLFHYASFFHVPKNPEPEHVHQPEAVKKTQEQVNPKPVITMPVMPFPMSLTSVVSQPQPKSQLEDTFINKPQIEVETDTRTTKLHGISYSVNVENITFENKILDLCHDDISDDYFNMNKVTLNRTLDMIYHSLQKKDHVLKRKIQVQCIAEAFDYILKNAPIRNKLPFSSASGIWSLLAANNKELSNQQLKLIGILKLGLIQLTQKMVDEEIDTKEIRNMLYYAKHLINFSRSRFHEPYYTDTGNEISNILVRVEHPFPATFS